MRKLTILWALAAMAMLPGAASAMTFGGEVFGAYNTYAMEDVNDVIDDANSLGADFDEFGSGLTGGLGLRMWASPQFMLAAHWEPLFLETEDSGTTINMDANSFQLTGGWFFPSTSNARYGIGGGLGYYTLGGEISDDTGTLAEADGSGVGFHLLGMGEWTMSPGFALTGGAGYRFADIEIDDAGGDTADYSGFMGRVGLAFYFPTSTP
jgi:hypothetical protein